MLICAIVVVFETKSLLADAVRDVAVGNADVDTSDVYNPWRKAQWMKMLNIILYMASKAVFAFGLPSHQRLLLSL